MLSGLLLVKHRSDRDLDVCLVKGDFAVWKRRLHSCKNFPRRGHACLLNFLFVASTDPLSMGPQKALETIGANLQKQYENWQPRVSLLGLPFLS